MYRRISSVLSIYFSKYGTISDFTSSGVTCAIPGRLVCDLITQRKSVSLICCAKSIASAGFSCATPPSRRTSIALHTSSSARRLTRPRSNKWSSGSGRGDGNKPQTYPIRASHSANSRGGIFWSIRALLTGPASLSSFVSRLRSFNRSLSTCLGIRHVEGTTAEPNARTTSGVNSPQIRRIMENGMSFLMS